MILSKNPLMNFISCYHVIIVGSARKTKLVSTLSESVNIFLRRSLIDGVKQKIFFVEESV